MDNLDIFRKAASALEAGQNIALLTVIAAIGSTPGKVGYKMLVAAKGSETSGTIGGGLVEAELIEAARNMLAQPMCRVFRFDLGAAPDDEKGICGGTVEILIETFDRKAFPLFTDISTACCNNEGGVLVSIISPDQLPRKILLRNVEQIGTTAGIKLAPEILAAITELAAAGHGATKASAGDMDVFVEGLAKPPMVVILGAGHLSYHICRYAKSVHFSVAVCDDRPEYANSERFPDADTIIVDDFARILDKVGIDGDSYIVIVTRGHKCDQIVLEQAVKTNARYIGMIGSKRKTLTILDKLRQKGVSEHLLNKVYSPIGISIGAVTPQEIALSIVSELVKIRRLGDTPEISHLAISRNPTGVAP